jgi:signal transduction histidine kinase
MDLLSHLLQEHTNAGYRVAIETEGDTLGLSSTTSLTAYRIIQEALTNIRKHASKDDSASVLVRTTSDSLRIEIVNSLSHAHQQNRRVSMFSGQHSSGPQSSSTQGFGPQSFGPIPSPVGLGIRGMTERATLLGGRLVAGTIGASFRVEADLPLRLHAPS